MTKAHALNPSLNDRFIEVLIATPEIPILETRRRGTSYYSAGVHEPGTSMSTFVKGEKRA